MDFTEESTRTAANTISPSSNPSPQKYGDKLLDYYVNDQDDLQGEYKDPATLAQYAYSQASDRDKMNFNDWSVHHGVDQFIANAPGALAKKQEADAFAASQPEDRGFFSGTATALGRGAMDLVGAAGQTLSLADFTPAAVDKDKGILDRAGEGLTKWAEDKKANTQFLRPTKEEESGEQGYAKKSWEGGVQSIVTSAAPIAAGLAGAKAGATAGAAFGPVGAAIGGTVGGLGAYAITRFGLFGAGVYGDTYDKTFAELKATRPGISDEEAHRVANKGAWIDAISENVSEAAGDAAAFFTFGGTKVLQQPLKATVREVMRKGIRGIAVDVAKEMPFEVGTEVANAYVGAKWRQAEGLSGGDTGAAMLDSAGPAVVMSLLMGGGVAGYTEVKARRTIGNLNSEDAGLRAKTANEIAVNISERTKDPELAEAWRKEAFTRIEDGKSIDVDETLVKFGANKVRAEAAETGEEIPVTADETEAPTEPRQQSAAEQILTGGEDVTPEDILLGQDASQDASQEMAETSGITSDIAQDASQIASGQDAGTQPQVQDISAQIQALESQRADIARKISNIDSGGMIERRSKTVQYNRAMLSEDLKTIDDNIDALKGQMPTPQPTPVEAPQEWPVTSPVSQAQPEQKMYQNGGENVSLSPVHPIDATEQRKQIAKLRTQIANLGERLDKEKNEKGRAKLTAKIEKAKGELNELLTNQQIPMEGDYGPAAETGVVVGIGSANARQGMQGQVGVVPQNDNAGISQTIQPGNTATDNGPQSRRLDDVIAEAENIHHRLAAEGHISQDVADQISAMPSDEVSEAESRLAYESDHAAAMRESRMATHDGLVGEIRRLGGIHPDQLDDATATALRDALGKDIVSKKGQPLDILSSVLTIDRTDIEGDSRELVRLLLDVSETKKAIDDDFKSKVDELKTAVLDARTRRDEQEAVRQGKVELADDNPRTVKESSTVQPADQPRAETVTAPSTGEASKSTKEVQNGKEEAKTEALLGAKDIKEKIAYILDNLQDNKVQRTRQLERVDMFRQQLVKMGEKDVYPVRIVGYEWRSVDGEKYSTWDDGLVSKRISDWDNNEVSEGSGKKIVHVYFVQESDGTIHPHGRTSAVNRLVSSGQSRMGAEFEAKKAKAGLTIPSPRLTKPVTVEDMPNGGGGGDDGNGVDALSVLLSLPEDGGITREEAERQAEQQRLENTKHVRSEIEKSKKKMAKFRAEAEKWEAKRYKDNNAKVTVGGKDHFDESRTMSIGEVNQRKRANAIRDNHRAYNDEAKRKAALEELLGGSRKLSESEVESYVDGRISDKDDLLKYESLATVKAKERRGNGESLEIVREKSRVEQPTAAPKSDAEQAKDFARANLDNARSAYSLWNEIRDEHNKNERPERREASRYIRDTLAATGEEPSLSDIAKRFDMPEAEAYSLAQFDGKDSWRARGPARLGVKDSDKVLSALGLVRDGEAKGLFDKPDDALYQSVYHGSPHRFDKFLLDHIGSGEGAQAYGFGLYFAGKKDVAEFYRQKLSRQTEFTFDGESLYPHGSFDVSDHVASAAHAIAADISRTGASLEEARSRFLQDVELRRAGSNDNLFVDQKKAAESITKDRFKVKKSGQLYRAEIPEDDVMLHWDKPLSEQPEKVRKAIFRAKRQSDGWADAPEGMMERSVGPMTGKDVYLDYVARNGTNQRVASEYLNSLGIKGIKYLDGSSRDSGDGSYNYVIFDDQAISILETYYQRVQDAGSMSPQPIDIRKVFAGSKYTVQQYKDGSVRIGHGSNQFTIRTVEQISPDRVAFEMKYGRKFDPNAESIAGRYLPSETTAEIVRGVGDKWTVWHETYHALEDIGVIKPFEQAVLNNAVDKADKAGTLRFDPMGDDGKMMKGDELRAYYVQHELAAREFDRKTTLGKVLQKIADFVDRIANLFTRTARGVVRDVESGRVMGSEGAGSGVNGQQYQSAATAGASPDETADAAEKWRTMGVESPYFKMWSGGAPVVLKNAPQRFITGQAVVVEAYHGSPDARFVQEDGIFKSENDRYGFGRSDAAHWFTRDIGTAKTYADPRRAFDYQRAEPGVISAYVRLDNPLVVDAAGKNWREAQNRGKTSGIIAEARANGHDGVIIYNVKDDYNNDKKTRATTTLTVFSSTQIKSTDNRGTFSPSDPRIQYQTMAKAGQQVRDFVSDATHSPEVFNRIFKNFQTQYHKALKHPVFKKFFDRIHEAAGTQQRAAARASQLAKDILPAYDEGFTETMRQLVSRGKVKQSDLREVSRIMSRLTLMGEDSSPTSGHRLTDGPGGEIEALRRGETITIGEESFSMTPAQVDLYEQARKSLDQMLKDMATSQAWAESRGVLKDKGYWRALSDNPVNPQELLQSMLDDEMQAQQDALAQVQQDDNDEAQAKKIKKIERTLDAIEQAKKDVDRIFADSKKLIDAGYVPLSRFGKYRIDVHNDKNELVYVGFYDTAKEANGARRDLGRMFVDGESVGDVQTVSQDAWRLYQGQNPEALMLFAKKAGAESGAIQTYYKEALSSRSAMKRLIRRKGYAGYSDDLQRILASFITSGAKKVSSNYHAAALSDMLSVDSIPGDVKDEMIALQKYVQDPGSNGAAFRAFAANWYMLGSMATAAWNGTQVVTSTLPELYKYSGSVGGSTKELWKAYKSLAKKGVDFTAAERAAIKRAMEDGTIEAAEIHHLYQQATKRFVNKLGQGEAARWAGSFLRLWGMPFAWFETMNRKASFIAAFRMGEDLKVKDPYAFAKQIVDVTQGIYQTHNRPNVARGAVGGAVMTFMQYKIQTLEQISRNMKEGGQARRAAMLQLAIIASLGGWKALPGAEDIADLFDAIMQIMGGKAWLTQREVRKAVEKGATDAAGLLLEKEAAAAVGKFSADFIHAGISAALPVDVSGRASMGQLVPGVKLLKPSTQYRDSEIFDMAGVPGSMVQSLLDASQMAMQGKMGQAAMRLAPNAVANAAKGVRIGLTGEIGNMAGRKITDGNMGDVLMQAVGAQPRKKTEITGKLREGNELKYLVQQKEREFVNQWADSYSEKTPADRKAALDAVREAMFDWNRSNPDWPIRITAQQVQRVLAMRKRTTTELALKSAPREIRRTMGDL